MRELSVWNVWLEDWKMVARFIWTVILFILVPPTLGYTFFVMVIRIDNWLLSTDPSNYYFRAYEKWIEFLKQASLVLLGFPTLGFTWAVLFVRNRKPS